MHIKNLTFNMVPNSLRHPAKSGQYLVATTYELYGTRYIGYMATLRYSKKHDAWNVEDNDTDTHTQIAHDRILAWTPFESIKDNLQPMVNEYQMETLEAKLARARAKAALAEITEEAAHEQ